MDTEAEEAEEKQMNDTIKTDAIERIQKFIHEWLKSTSRDNSIYGLHIGTERECILTIDDISALIANQIKGRCGKCSLKDNCQQYKLKYKDNHYCSYFTPKSNA
jgi:hypothetical protein